MAKKFLREVIEEMSRDKFAELVVEQVEKHGFIKWRWQGQDVGIAQRGPDNGYDWFIGLDVGLREFATAADALQVLRKKMNDEEQLSALAQDRDYLFVSQNGPRWNIIKITKKAEEVGLSFDTQQEADAWLAELRRR